MKIAICDDESSCNDKLLLLIKEYFSKKMLDTECFVFCDPIQFMESELIQYDLVFLDANMGEISGIDVAKALREVNQSAILVYISAYVEYAPMGYGVNAFRYLMKNSLEFIFDDCMDEMMHKFHQMKKQINLVTTQGINNINVSNLQYIESFRHLLIFHMTNGEQLESKQYTLLECSEVLKAHHFLRIHKSYLVNPEHIQSIKNKRATLHNGIVLNCGKKAYQITLHTFLIWRGGL